jgi:hypothetical protein
LVVRKADARHPVPVTGNANRLLPNQHGNRDAMREDAMKIGAKIFSRNDFLFEKRNRKQERERDSHRPFPFPVPIPVIYTL